MSIAVLTQVYDEMRRLAIAGSVVAGGDFRLKKLVPPLEQAGAKAPVFGKVAEAVKSVVDGKPEEGAEALLELTTLVNAILYTQGETGVAGTLEAIDTTDLGAPTSQSSARVLKPLLEALTTTGSGRLELIRDAHERGAFRDLRLVKPALNAIDDVYAEIADFIADRVLPLYGKAILPELRAKLDLHGRGGHPRRLKLLHSLDPSSTRELVQQVLDGGSKEMKVVAIECLGASPADLSYLLEQVGAKAQEVRLAAYRALSLMKEDAAVTVLQKTLTGKDLELAAESLRGNRDARLLKNIISEASEEIAALPKIKDKKEAGKKMRRAQVLIGCLHGRDDRDSEAFLLNVFGQREELAKVKGDVVSGSDLVSTIVHVMEHGSAKLRTTLAEAHASLSGDNLEPSFRAARQVFPPARVYEMYSPYLAAKVDNRKKDRGGVWNKRQAIIQAIGGHHSYYGLPQEDKAPPLDPRWLDAAVELRDLALIWQLARPGHAATNAFLSETFASVVKSSKAIHDCHQIVSCMVHAAHPEAADALIAAFEKHAKSADYYGYWFGHLIPELPKSALPKLEVLVPKMKDRVADSLLGYIQQLREKA